MDTNTLSHNALDAESEYWTYISLIFQINRTSLKHTIRDRKQVRMAMIHHFKLAKNSFRNVHIIRRLSTCEQK